MSDNILTSTIVGIILVIFILLLFLVAHMAKRRGRSKTTWVLLSILLTSPVLPIIILLIIGKSDRKKREELEEQAKIYAKYINPDLNPYSRSGIEKRQTRSEVANNREIPNEIKLRQEEIDETHNRTQSDNRQSDDNTFGKVLLVLLLLIVVSCVVYSVYRLVNENSDSNWTQSSSGQQTNVAESYGESTKKYYGQDVETMALYIDAHKDQFEMVSVGAVDGILIPLVQYTTTYLEPTKRRKYVLIFKSNGDNVALVTENADIDFWHEKYKKAEQLREDRIEGKYNPADNNEETTKSQSNNNYTSSSQQITNQNLTIDTFSKIPDDVYGCSCTFSNDSVEYNKKQYIFTSDITEVLYMKINGKMIKFNLNNDGSVEMNSIPHAGSKIKIENSLYKIVIEYDKVIGSGYETRAMTGSIQLTDIKNGNTIVKKIFGVCGC